MSSTPNVLKGYIKTENVILLILLGIVAGFVAGVVFSAYRTGGRTSATTGGQAVPLSAEQSQTLEALLHQTKENPQNFEAWAHLGHFFFDTDQPDKAIEAYQHALALDESRPDVWTDMGVMYRHTGQPQKAIQSFEQALKLDPTHEIATFNIGVVRMHDLQDPAGALQAWEKLVAINPAAKTPGGQLVHDMVAELKKRNPVEKEVPKP